MIKLVVKDVLQKLADNGFSGVTTREMSVACKISTARARKELTAVGAYLIKRGNQSFWAFDIKPNPLLCHREGAIGDLFESNYDNALSDEEHWYEENGFQIVDLEYFM